MEDGNATKISNVRYEDESSMSSTSEISLHFMNMSTPLHNIMTKLAHYITTFHKCYERFPISPRILGRKEKEVDERGAFYNTLPGGSDVWKYFEKDFLLILQ